MGFAADVYLIGAQKAGTTSFAGLLAQHPDICLSSPKEPHYFTKNLPRGEAWYRQCFVESRRLLLDASTSYTQAHLDPARRSGTSPLDGVPQRIKAANPRARFIYLVRDPVARAYSGYWHAVRVGDERRPFHEAIEASPQYLDQSDYAGQLGVYLEHFPRDRFHILTFESFKRDPTGCVRECLEFLGLEAGKLELDAADRARNASYQYNGVGRWVATLLNERGAFKRMTGVAKQLLPAGLYRRLGGLLTRQIPPLDAATRSALESRLAASMGAFAELTGIDYRRG